MSDEATAVPPAAELLLDIYRVAKRAQLAEKPDFKLAADALKVVYQEQMRLAGSGGEAPSLEDARALVDGEA